MTSTTAAQAREAARRASGQFGEQNRDDPGSTLLDSTTPGRPGQRRPAAKPPRLWGAARRQAKQQLAAKTDQLQQNRDILTSRRKRLDTARMAMLVQPQSVTARSQFEQAVELVGISEQIVVRLEANVNDLRWKLGER